MNTKEISLTTLVAIFLLGITVLCLWGCPKYNVYRQQKEGEALLAHAQSSREVAVAEAKKQERQK